MSKKPKRKPQDPVFERVRAKIRASANLHQGLAKFKTSGKLEDLRAVLPQLAQHPTYRSLIWAQPTPRNYKFLGGGGIPVLSDLRRELLWCVQTLLPHADAINEFVKLKNAFETAFLFGHSDDIEVALQQIEETLGVSLWLAESRISYLQTFKGYSHQREFSDGIAGNQGPHPLIRYLLRWISSRSAQNTSPQEFYKLLSEMLPVEHGFAALTHLILGDSRIETQRLAGGALSFTDMFPIIDRYWLTVTVCQAYCAGLTDGHPDLALMREELTPLVAVVQDASLRRLYAALGGASSEGPPSELCELIDLFLLGGYSEVVASGAAILSEQPSVELIQLILTAARAATVRFDLPGRFTTDSPVARIVEDLRKVVEHDTDYNDARNRLWKIVLINSSASWSATLRLILESYPRDPAAYGSDASKAFSALRAAQSLPSLAYSLAQFGGHDGYLQALERSSRCSKSIAVARAILQGSSDHWDRLTKLGLSSSQIQMSKVVSALRHKEYATAVEHSSRMYEQGGSIMQADVGVHHVEGLLQLVSLSECCKVAVSLFQQSEAFASELPLGKLLQAIISSQAARSLDPQFFSQLPAVLVFDIYSRFVSSDHDSDRADAFNDFLSVNGIKYASSLINSPDRFVLADLVQFLKHVCVPDVLDQSLALDSTRAVEDERAKILVLLSELTAADGKPPSSDLLEELSTIKTRQVVRDTAFRLDQSKVYVNVDGIKKAVAGQLREAWGRYKLLLTQQSMPGFDELQRVLERALGERVAVFSLSLPLTESDKLFTRIWSELKEMFTLSKEFGLDANLSTNIRHGFVMREIRGPFVLRNLVTNKLSTEGGYQRNEYWADRLTELHSDGLEDVIEALAVFSEQVDAQIEHLNRRLIRIRSEQAPEGLFEYSFDRLALHFLQRRCEQAETYDEFVEAILEDLWARTNKGLESLRSTLTSTTLVNVQTALEALQMTLHKYRTDPDISALSAAVNLVRPELRSAIERVASWFTLSGNNEYQDFDLRISYEAGLATVRSYYSHLTIDSEFDSDAIILAGRTLPFFARLFSILLDNSAYHSGLTGGTLLLRSSARYDGSVLNISVQNNMAATVDLEHVRQRVAWVNSEFGRERASTLIREEGGSGYPKIWKILKHDLGGEHALQVLLTSENEFLVEIMIDARGMIP